jgi:hypothetical protein
MRARVKWDPRMGRLVTSIQLFTEDLVAAQASGVGYAQHAWLDRSGRELEQAKVAAEQRRIDDAWELLHAAQRSLLQTASLDELRLTACQLWYECGSKLTGHRRESAVAALVDSGLLPVDLVVPAPPPGAAAGTAEPAPALRTAPEQPSAADVERARHGVVQARAMLDAHSQNAYLSVRLLGIRLVASSLVLFVVLVTLGLVTAWADPGSASAGVLVEGGQYLRTVLLGALGALLSFAIGSLQTRQHRIYELASGTFATLAARLMVGSAAAIVVVAAIESGLIAIPAETAPLFAVAAGFSERLVRRVVETLSAVAEKDPRT